MPASIADSDADYDPREHQPCYVFTPSSVQQPQPKRRKVNTAQKRGRGKRAVPDESDHEHEAEKEEEIPCPFPRLFDGKEPAALAEKRWEAYNRLWSGVEVGVEEVLENMDEGAVNEICGFLAGREVAREVTVDGEEEVEVEEEESLFDDEDDAESLSIRTGLVLAGPNIASHAVLFSKLKTRIAEDGIGRVVLLTSSDSGGIKGVLKKIVKEGTRGEGGGEDEDEADANVGRDRDGKKLLNYDLQILVDWVARKDDVGKIVVAIQDTEAFDSSVFAQLVDLMIAYLNRIPFVLLLGVATSIEITQSKLPKHTIRKLNCRKFDVERAEECLEEVFRHAIIGGEDDGTAPPLHIGPDLCNFMIRRQRDYTISIQGFISGLKFVYMTHFYANPLSILLGIEDEQELKEVLTEHHFRAIRNLRSFQRLVEYHLSQNEHHVVSLLLSDDDYLQTRIHHTLISARKHTHQVAQIPNIFKTARSFTYLSNARMDPLPDLYIKLLSGNFHTTSLVREFLMSVKKLNSMKLTDFLRTLTTHFPASPLSEKLSTLLAGLETLLRDLPSHAKSIPLTLPTASSRLVPTPSTPSDALGEKTVLFNHIISQVHQTLHHFFSTQSTNLRATHGTGVEHGFLAEVLTYDYLSPSKECFLPNIRGVVENAIFNPKDYLPCTCCPGDDDDDDDDEEEEEGSDAEEKKGDDEDGVEAWNRKPKRQKGELGVLAGTQPATTILYRLYCESGAMVNMYDLWQAFWSIVGSGNEDGDGEDGEEEEGGEKGMSKELAQALFYRGVAELRFLGFVKYTKRKRDCLAKLAWKGL